MSEPPTNPDPADAATPAETPREPAGHPETVETATATTPAASTNAVADESGPATAGPANAARRSPVAMLAAIVLAFALGSAVALAAYVAINSGKWIGAGTPQTLDTATMSVPRGSAKRDGATLVAQAPANDVLIVALPTSFLARELSAVAWDVDDVPPGADVRLLFNTDYKPRAVQSRALVVEEGRVQPISLAGDPDWIGRITGLALAVRAPGAAIRVRGVTVKPQTASQLIGDRAREWFRFEPWNGTSINSVTGGAQAQSLPLPVAVTIAALIALAALAVVRKLVSARMPRELVAIAAGLFVVGWAVLDLRWTVNLARQNAATLERYGGLDAEGRALAAEDGDLARFLEKAKAAMPVEPQRVVVLSSAHYYRGRAGWHLMPHRAMWAPTVDAAPAGGTLRTGDFLVVWQDTHARFDAGSGRLRFDNGVDLPAKLVLADGDGAVYAIL